MDYRSRHDGFPAYVSVSERRAQAEEAIAQLRITHPHIRPVTIRGRQLASTWWGKSWNRNLECYADYANRIQRGRSYVRHGAVLDLTIDRGSVSALVQGSEPTPYRVSVTIDPLGEKAWQSMVNRSREYLTSLEDLITGVFPKNLETLLMEPGKLFPSPQEIHLHCSCPDVAKLCKHVSAVLYGVGTRLDEDPRLFFALRHVHLDDFVDQAVTEESKRLRLKAENPSQRTIPKPSDADLSVLFGIDIDNDEE